MTKASQFTCFADAVEAAARTDRELQLDTDAIALKRTARVADPDNLKIWGAGNKTQVRPTAAMVARDWLDLGNKGSDGTENLLLDSFLFNPPAGMRGGWAVRMQKCGRTQINNVDVGGNSGMTPHMAQGGFWFDGYDKCSVTHSNIYAHHKGILLNGLGENSWGADFTLDTDTKIQNHRRPDYSDSQPGAVGVHCAGGQGGTYLNGNIIFCGIGVLVDRAMGWANREIFILPGAIIDSCLDDGIRAMENSYGTIQCTGVWSASHGRAGGGSGLRVHGAQLPNSKLLVTGGQFFNNQGDGIVLNGGWAHLSGVTFAHNRDYDLHIASGSVKGVADGVASQSGPVKVRNVSSSFKTRTL